LLGSASVASADLAAERAIAPEPVHRRLSGRSRAVAWAR
jgi:hypothetical protein